MLVRTRHQIHLKSSISPIEPLVALRGPMHLRACVSEERGDGRVRALWRLFAWLSKEVEEWLFAWLSKEVQCSGASVAMMSRIESVSSDHSVLLFEGTDSCSHIGKKLLQRFVDVLLVKHT